MRDEDYKRIANGFGCTVGTASNIPLGLCDRVGRSILQAIDMGEYQRLQRRLLAGNWGRWGTVRRYTEMIKKLRNDKAKRRQV
jgi:hypothetical protein